MIKQPTNKLKIRIWSPSWVAVVTLTDRPKSIRNRCVIDVFGRVFVLSRCFLDFFCWCRGFCNRTESDLFLFLPNQCALFDSSR